MRLRHITGSEDFVSNSPYVVHEPQSYRGRWKQGFFGSEHPLYLEIGMGKGQFITGMAELNPDCSFIGVERYDTVLMKALLKREKREAEGVSLGNLSYLSIDARLLSECFAESEVDGIYLNFSDPWPKARQANRRLTSPVFMRVYEQIISRDGRLEFKTDNEALFDYSLESIPEAGWSIECVSRDLHNDSTMNAGNVMTEYEEKFSKRGNPIYKLIALPPKSL